MRDLALALVAGLLLAGGTAGCGAHDMAGRSGTAGSRELEPRPDGPALGTGPWSLTGERPSGTRGPALGYGAPGPQSP